MSTNEADEMYPKPVRVYLTLAQMRAVVWLARQHGLAAHELIRRGGVRQARELAAQRIARGQAVPPAVAQALAGMDSEPPNDQAER